MEDRDLLRRLVGQPEEGLDHTDPAVRRLAVAICADRASQPGVRRRLKDLLSSDPDEDVRAEAAESLGRAGADGREALRAAATDTSARVVEAVASSLGEVGDEADVPWLIEVAGAHPETIVRESAVAALGSIGGPEARHFLLGAVREGKPQVRRRAVVALTAFDGPDVERALLDARADRNPMVREAAEMVMGRE